MGGMVLSKTTGNKKEKICYQYAVDLNPQVFLLIFLAKVYRFDLETLLLLYDRLGDDIIYVFFLLAGRTIVIPKHTRMLKLIQFSKKACDAIFRGEELGQMTTQESEVMSFLKELYNKKTRKIVVKTEIPHMKHVYNEK